jgi:hypothetical protein
MRYPSLVFSVILLILIGSCQADNKTIKESERDAMIDSLVGIRMEEVNRQAMEDLDRRRSIEIKAKADSIVSSKQPRLEAIDTGITKTKLFPKLK